MNTGTPRSALAAVALMGVIGFSSQALAAGGGAAVSDPGAKEGKHFDSKGKMPSKFTIELQNGLRK